VSITVIEQPTVKGDGGVAPTDALRTLAARCGLLIGSGQCAARHLAGQLLVELDQKIAASVDACRSSPAFRRLESSWRSIDWLCRQTPPSDPDNPTVRIELFPATLIEIARDLRTENSVRRSVLYRKLYTERLGTLGGTPVGMIVIDWEFGEAAGFERRPGVRLSDIELIERLAMIASACFAPMVAGASPRLFGSGVTGFHQVWSGAQIRLRFESPEFGAWRRFRRQDTSRYVALVLPRILLRAPTRRDDPFAHTFAYRDCGPESERNDGCVWGCGAFAVAAVTARAFHRSGWGAEIRGVDRDGDGRIAIGGGVIETAAIGWRSDGARVTWRPTTDAVFDEETGRELARHGFIPLWWCKGTPLTAILAAPTYHDPEQYMSTEATANAWIAAQLPQILCACRFAQLVKRLGLNALASFRDAPTIQKQCHEWLMQYVNTVKDEIQSDAPLLGGSVEAVEPEPGTVALTIRIQPRYQFDAIGPTIVLRAELDRSR